MGPRTPVALARRNVLLLAASQALAMTGIGLVATITALVGMELAPSAALATLPLALQFFATTAAAVPAAMLMKRIGRRGGFLLGVAFGVLGGASSTYAIVQGDFWLFAAAGALLGVFNCFAQYYRFAAAESATPEFRGTAISLVMAGGVVAALAGPNLPLYTREWFEAAQFAGSYFALVLLQLAAGVLLAFVRIPHVAPELHAAAARPLARIARQPAFWVAVLAGMVGYACMVLLMSATPLAMHAHGHGLPDTAFVIEWHMLGMFAPAFFTGHLVRRFGAVGVILAGAALMLGGVATNLAGTEVMHFWFALVAVGVGWNFMYVGASTLLTEAYRPAEAAKSQGANELLIWAAVSLAVLSSGALQHHWGWEMVNLAVIPLLAAPLAATLWLGSRRVAACAPG